MRPLHNGAPDAPTSTLDSSSTAPPVTPGGMDDSAQPSAGVSVSVQPTTTTPGRRERRSKARKRHANFATQETNMLLAEIRRSRHILFNVISPSITPTRKVAVWEEISARLAARGWNRRAGKELRRKWENLRYETKIKFMKQLRGEQYHLKWTPLNSEVLQLMREDATYSLPSAIEEWKALPPDPPSPSPSPSQEEAGAGAGAGAGAEEPNCEAIAAAAARAVESFMCDSNKSEPSVEVKSEGGPGPGPGPGGPAGDPCHLMSHLHALEPDMLHPALRSIEMSGSIPDSDGPGLAGERIDALEPHLPAFPGLAIGEPVGVGVGVGAPPPAASPPSVARLVQPAAAAAAAAAADTEVRLRLEVLRMKHEAYRAKRDYYLAKMRTLR